MATFVKAKGRSAVLHFQLNNDNLRKLRSMPGKKEWQGNRLIFEPTAPALDYVRQQFPEAEWDEDSRRYCEVADKMRAQAAARPPAEVHDYVYKMKPYAHQDVLFRKSRDLPVYAYLMEQGTGKTKPALDTAAYLYSQGKIQGLLVVAKNGVHRNWIDNEIPAHLPDWLPRRVAFWTAKKGEKGIANVFRNDPDRPSLAILTINTEALSTKRGEKICEQFLMAYPSMMVIDESTSIKSPGAKRTKAILRLGNYAPFRRILTGTPITKGPLDAYTQFLFLDEDILGFGSFYAYRAHYAVMRPLPGKTFHGRPIQIVVGYQNVDELQKKIKAYSMRILKKDCLDLPPKVYQRELFEMTEQQWKHYEELEEDVVTEFQGRRISAPLAMTKMMRLHQISCGFMPPEDPKKEMGVAINESNPRLEALLDLVENIEGKIIIFGIYRFSLREVYAALGERYGKESTVAYAGNISTDDRARAITAFQSETSPVRFFVAQTHAAGYGLTLTAARTVIYYSNDNSLEARLQSEDRAHRIGQTGSVLYIDLLARGTVDEDILDNLRTKKAIAEQICDDPNEHWLESKEMENDATTLLNKIIQRRESRS